MVVLGPHRVSDMASFAMAVETIKRYVRAKIKKGKGKEVSGPTGKVGRLHRHSEGRMLNNHSSRPWN